VETLDLRRLVDVKLFFKYELVVLQLKRELVVTFPKPVWWYYKGNHVHVLRFEFTSTRCEHRRIQSAQ